jgi:hypothetical protein
MKVMVAGHGRVGAVMAACLASNLNVRLGSEVKSLPDCKGIGW